MCRPCATPLNSLAPRTDELAVAIEHHHRVGAVARRVHGVVHVDVALRVLDDAVGVAPLDARRQLAPVVNRFVGVGAARRAPAPSCRPCPARRAAAETAGAAAAVARNSRRVVFMGSATPATQTNRGSACPCRPWSRRPAGARRRTTCRAECRARDTSSRAGLP